MGQTRPYIGLHKTDGLPPIPDSRSVAHTFGSLTPTSGPSRAASGRKRSAIFGLPRCDKNSRRGRSRSRHVARSPRERGRSIGRASALEKCNRDDGDRSWRSGGCSPCRPRFVARRRGHSLSQPCTRYCISRARTHISPPAAYGVDSACHPAADCHQEVDGKVRPVRLQMSCRKISLRHLCADPDRRSHGAIGDNDRVA